MSVLAAGSVRAADGDLHLPPPLFPSAVQLWRDAQPADALAVLERQRGGAADDDQPLEALVLGAALLEAAERHTEAEALWAAVIEHQVWMRTFSRRKLVENRVARGDADGAAQFLAELSRSDATRHLDLIIGVADLYAQAGDLEAATRFYRRVLARQNRGVWADAARLGLAGVLERARDLDSALITLRNAQLLHAGGDTYEQARHEERRLVNAGGRALTPLTEGQYRTVVRRLRSGSRFQPALALLDDWEAANGSINKPGPDRDRAYRDALRATCE